MFLIRRAKVEDVGTLFKLAKMVHFINLPADRDIITDKVMKSRESFLKSLQGPTRDDERAAHNGATSHARSERALARSSNGYVQPHLPALRELVAAGNDGRSLPPPGRHADPHGANPAATNLPRAVVGGEGGLASLIHTSHLFLFVLEDTSIADDKGGGVLGTSQIISKMGGPGHPNVSFRLSRREKFSSTLQVGATHIVAKLFLDESSPTEIGGLILQPSYRGHKLRLGRFLSLVRFHVMGLHRWMFSSKVLAEMMGPMTPDGRNTLWEYLGRRFINLTYAEADSFCQYSKEFMTALLPHEEIYLTVLPPEARAVIAQVGPETLPARRMLEKLGFEYRDHIDPFDGGPHLEAQTDQIALVRDTVRARLGDPVAAGKCKSHGIVSVIDGDGEFRAIETDFELTTRGSGRISLAKPQMKLLKAEPGMEMGVTPMGSSGAHPTTAAARRRSSRT